VLEARALEQLGWTGAVRAGCAARGGLCHAGHGAGRVRRRGAGCAAQRDPAARAGCGTGDGEYAGAAAAYDKVLASEARRHPRPRWR